MQPRTTAVLFLIAAGLAAFVYFYEIRGGEERKEAEALAKRLFPGIEGFQVEAIELRTTDGHDVRLERRGETWQLAEPIGFPADEVSVDGMASSLAAVASEGVIDEPQPAKVYGLDDEGQIVRFRAEGQEQLLRIGGRSPVGGGTYVATQDLSRIYTVPTYRVSSFQKSLDDLREKRLLRFDRAWVEGVEIRWPGGGVSLLKEGDQWHLEEPIEGRADDSTVETLLSDLSFLRANSFLDVPDESARAALEKPQYEVWLRGAEVEGEEPLVYELAIGGVRDGGERVARSGDPETFYTLAAERLDDFPRELAQYRFRTLAEFSVADAKRIELFFHPRTEDRNEVVSIVAEQEERGWVSDAEGILPGKAARLVSELSRLKADSIVADSMGSEELAALGLAPPTVILRVSGEASEGEETAPVLAEIHIGQADPQRGIAARTLARDAVYRVDYELAEHVPINLDAFRNRFASQEKSGEDTAAGDDEAPMQGGEEAAAGAGP